VTSMRTASILSNIGFRTKGGVRSTLNKIARLGKIFERGKSPEELEQRDWLQEYCLREPLTPMHGFHHLQHLFARKRFSSSLRRKNSKSSLQTLSDQLAREVKSAQYCTVEYKID